MTQPIAQSEVNSICDQIKAQGQVITISLVRSMLGKGTHSQLVEAVLRYKTDEIKAKEYAQKESQIQIRDEETQQKNKQKIRTTKKETLIDQLKSLNKKYNLALTEAQLIEVASLCDNHFKKQKEAEKNTHRKSTQQLKIEIDQLETRLYAANEQIQKQAAIIEHLNQQQLLFTKPETPKHNFKTQTLQKTEVKESIKKGPSVQEQLQPIHSARVAAYDFNTGNIILKANDFNAPLLKILRLNQKDVIAASVYYDYKTRYYHLSNCSKNTINFLKNYHFAFSDALTHQANKIF
ncbi:hypothetical protein L3V86_08970 [Thiotrichales bacterium 19S11-10]|nr:hypothetical protein [Thiotrichales bacterium 19S11-10]